MRKRRVGSGKGGEQRRRSARLSALEAAAAAAAAACSGKKGKSTSSSSVTKTTDRSNGDSKQQLVSGSGQSPVADQKIGRKRKRLEDSVESPIRTQDGENAKQGDTPIKTDRRANISSLQRLPEKHILEFVIDILQRKDTNEIFSEPVDPEEVEGYYKVIKEPMDFGTMRAKLQEGMYTTMEQFERDAFLISSNAMQFNSSTTIYYREARVIHELAQRVFHGLKTDPENFDKEFSLTRRRSARKPQSEARNMRPKLAKRGASPNGGMCSLNGPSLRRNKQSGLASSSSNHYVDRRDYDISSGSRCGRNLSFFETERHQTYRPYDFFLRDNQSIVSAFYDAPKTLLHNNHAGIGYEESLMRFVKDLGPTARMVANRKLGKYPIEAQSFQFRTPSLIPTAANVPRESAYPDSVNKVQMFRTLFYDFPGNHNVNKYANTTLGKTARENRRLDFDSTSRGDSVSIHGNRGIHIQEERAQANDKKHIKNDLLNTPYSKGKMMCTNDDKIHHAPIQFGPNFPVSRIEDLNSPAGITNTSSKYMTMDILSSKSSQMGNQVQPTQSATKSQPGFLGIMSRSSSCLNPPFLPLLTAKTLSLNQASTTLLGFGSYYRQGNNFASLNTNREASSSQTAQLFEWTRTTPWSMGSSTNP